MGVIGADGVAQILAGEVGVYLGGGEAFVPQHLLHGTQVGPVLHQFGSKTVAEAVGRDIFVYASFLDGLFDELEDCHAGEMVATEVEEDIFLLARLGRELAADGEEVGLQQAEGAGIDGHPTLFVALADDLQHLLFGIDVGELEVAQFGDAEAAAIKDFDNDVVAGRTGLAEVEGLLDGGDVVVAEHVGQMFGTGGHFD